MLCVHNLHFLADDEMMRGRLTGARLAADEAARGWHRR